MPRTPRTPEEYGTPYDPDFNDEDDNENKTNPEFEAALDRAIEKHKVKPIETEEEEEIVNYEPVDEDEEQVPYISPPKKKEKEPEWIQPQPSPNLMDNTLSAVQREQPPPPPIRPTGGVFNLYLKTSPTTFELMQSGFASRIEASQYAEQNYEGGNYKILSDEEAIALQQQLEEKQAKWEDRKQAIKTGAKKAFGEITTSAKKTAPKVKPYTDAFLMASREQAYQAGMVRGQIQPKVEKAWHKGEPRRESKGLKYQSDSKGRPKKPFIMPPRQKRKSNMFMPPKIKKVRLNVPKQGYGMGGYKPGYKSKPFGRLPSKSRGGFTPHQSIPKTRLNTQTMKPRTGNVRVTPIPKTRILSGPNPQSPFNIGKMNLYPGGFNPYKKQRRRKKR